jgi:predicted GTPase
VDTAGLRRKAKVSDIEFYVQHAQPASPQECDVCTRC